MAASTVIERFELIASEVSSAMSSLSIEDSIFPLEHLINEQNWSEIQHVLAVFPSAARTKQKFEEILEFPIFPVLRHGDKVPSDNKDDYHNVITFLLDLFSDLFAYESYKISFGTDAGEVNYRPLDSWFDRNGMHPLMIAIKNRDIYVMKEIIVREPRHLSVITASKDGTGPIDFALQQEGISEDIVNLLVDTNKNVIFNNRCGYYPVELALKNNFSRALFNKICIPALEVDLLGCAALNPQIDGDVFHSVLRLTKEKYDVYAQQHNLNPVTEKFVKAVQNVLTLCPQISIVRALFNSELARDVLRNSHNRCTQVLKLLLKISGGGAESCAVLKAHGLREGLPVLVDCLDRITGSFAQPEHIDKFMAVAIENNSPLLKYIANGRNCAALVKDDVSENKKKCHYTRNWLMFALNQQARAETIETLIYAYPDSLLCTEYMSWNNNARREYNWSVPLLAMKICAAPAVLAVLLKAIQTHPYQAHMQELSSDCTSQLKNRFLEITRDTAQDEREAVVAWMEHFIALDKISGLGYFVSVEFLSPEAIGKIVERNKRSSKDEHMRTNQAGWLPLHTCLHRPEIVSLLLGASETNAQRTALVTCTLPHHPSPHKQVTAVEIAVARNCPLDSIKLLMHHERGLDVLCTLAVKNCVDVSTCLFLFKQYPDELTSALLYEALLNRCDNEVVTAILDSRAVIDSLAMDPRFTAHAHPVLEVLLQADEYDKSVIERIMAAFSDSGVDPGLVSTALQREKVTEEVIRMLLTLLQKKKEKDSLSGTDISNNNTTTVFTTNPASFPHPLHLALSHGLRGVYYSTDLFQELIAAFPGGATLSSDFTSDGLQDLPLVFALRLGYAAEVLALILADHPAAALSPVHSRTKRLIPLWERVVRDSESSQREDEKEPTKTTRSVDGGNEEYELNTENMVEQMVTPELIKEQDREQFHLLSTSCAGVAEICTVALERECDKRMFIKLMSMPELAIKTATFIAARHLAKHPDWTYLCMEAGEKTSNNATRDMLHSYVFFCRRYQQAMGAPLHRSATAVVVEFADHGVMIEYSASYQLYAQTGGDLLAALRSIHVQADEEHVKQLQTFLVEEGANGDGSCSGSYTDSSPSLSPSPLKKTTGQPPSLLPSASPSRTLLSALQYETFCAEKFGRTRKVVIKFMKEKSQYEREIVIREQKKLDAQFVVPLLRRGPTPAAIAALEKEIESDLCDKRGVRNVPSEYKYGLIMPAADRSVQAIFLSERPEVNEVRVMMRHVGEALKHCHDERIVHADLKMLNVIRIGHRLRLIDFDAAVPIAKDSKLGVKFSSGILPPEMFEELSEEGVAKYEAYWKAEKDEKNSELWPKIAPRSLVYKGVVKHYVVKCYDADRNSPAKAHLPAHGTLPYIPVAASEAVDLWAFGLMLFTFLAGEPLLSTNRDDDLLSPADYRAVVSWTKRELDARLLPLLKKGYYTAVDLLSRLLHPNPIERNAQKLSHLLEHDLFFKEKPCTEGEREGGESKKNEEDRRVNQLILTEIMALKEHKNAEMNILLDIRARSERIESDTKRIPEMSAKLIKRLNKMEKVMLRAMVEVADVLTPSCFLIVNQKILGERDQCVSESDSKSMLQKAEGWAENLASLTNVLTDVLTKEGREKRINEAFDYIMQAETLYLYLIDESTTLPVVHFEHNNLHVPYPFEIKNCSSGEAKRLVSKIMPLLQAGLTAMTVANTALSVARCLGYPVPVLPPDLREKAGAAVDRLNKKSSVEQYDVLQQVLDVDYEGVKDGKAAGETPQNKSVRGAALREFARYLAEVDPLETYVGLRRVATDNGMCAWMTEESLQEMSRVAREEEVDEEKLIKDLSKKVNSPVPPPPPAPAAAPVQPIFINPSPPPLPIITTVQVEVDYPRAMAELARVTAELARLQQENSQQLQVIATLSAANHKHTEVIQEQSQNLSKLGEGVPICLDRMRTDIVDSIQKASKPAVAASTLPPPKKKGFF